MTAGGIVTAADTTTTSPAVFIHKNARQLPGVFSGLDI